MPIVVRCPSCRGRFNAPDKLAGKQAKCPKCGSTLPIPVSEEPGPSPQTSQLPTESHSLPVEVEPPRLPVWIEPTRLPQRAEHEPPTAIPILVPVPNPSARQNVKPPTKPCPFCGEEVLAVAKKCRYCGETIDVALRAAEETARLADASARQRDAPVIVTAVSGGSSSSSSSAAAAAAAGPRRRISACGCIFLALLLGFLGLVSFFACTGYLALSRSTTPNAVSPIQETLVKYRTVKSWKIPNGGEGKVILIDTQDATEARLMALASQLREEAAGERNAAVFVYDDLKAAGLRDKLADLSPSEERYYDKHFLGTYLKNSNTGFHQMDIHPQGLDGPVKTVKF